MPLITLWLAWFAATTASNASDLAVNFTGSVNLRGSQHGCANYGCVRYDRTHACQCNELCTKYGNCCFDFEAACHAPAAPAPPLPPTPPITKPPKANGSITIRGNMLFDASGHRFFAKGVAYNPRNANYNQIIGKKSQACKAGHPKFAELQYFADPVTDDLQQEWSSNLEAMAKLGVNLIRLYNIDPQASHQKFMSAAAALGIYVLVPLTRGDWGYLPATASPSCYNAEVADYAGTGQPGNVGTNLLSSAKQIVDQFSVYTNTLMFVVGNEIEQLDTNGYSAYPCVKALTRDIHRHQKAKSLRMIPLIYSSKDQGSPDRSIVAKYLSCEVETEDDIVDAFGLNVYSWCDQSYHEGSLNFNYSPYYSIMTDFTFMSSPMLLTEFGCTAGAFQWTCPYKGGRTWPQLKYITEDMNHLLSGAVAFEFSMENNEFGLAMTPGFVEGQPELRLTDSYYALQQQFATHHVADSAPATKNRPSCPSTQETRALQERHAVHSVADWSKLPPTPPSA
eukprot:TRINITY_DN11623_c0_g1_i1.p1 TRINITY_DN11623_c0_g1~~TRINITY_DN11623_c0_g1_i1.p1  ORF type:complete len:508 (+),score=84.20 TRINITY_DN11623_c0_g1_i1:117-1640(+)